MYADDTTLYSSGSSLEELQGHLQTCIDKAAEWFSANRLVVNSKKSTVSLIGTRQRIARNKLNVSIGTDELISCDNVKLLGVQIDPNLNWHLHVNHVVKTVNPKIGLLQRLAKFLPRDLLNVVYRTIVQPHFDYCLSIWGNCGKTAMCQVQRLQNRAARIVSGNYDFSQSGLSVVSCNDWMNMEERYNYFISVLMYKVLNGEVTSNLCNMFEYVSATHNHNTRNAASGQLKLPKCSVECFKRSFAYSGASLWNDIDDSVKLVENVHHFKRNYKQLYFNR